MNRRALVVFVFCLVINIAKAQMDLPPAAGNPRATISEEVGITSITLKYSRPDLNKREKIFGDGALVTPGFSTFNITENKSTSPWRAGANENTTIQFEHDVKVEGKELKAGIYSIHMAYGAENTIVIFNRNTEAWGSFYYKESEDALRVTVKTTLNNQKVEWLKYEFIEHAENFCVIALQWEKVIIPFKVEVDVNTIVVNRLREEYYSGKGLNPNNVLQAAQYCLNKNINLPEALDWSIRVINGIQGQKTFITLRNLATAYEKNKNIPLADSTMKEALLIATANQYSTYSRQLIGQKRADKAQEVALANLSRYGDNLTSNSLLMSTYSANADFKNALKFANKALLQAPNENVKKNINAS
jgi:tetratricopeptide (TPR) repeat protein